MILINLLLIQTILVFIVDLSGFIQDGIEPMLARWFKRPQVKLKKPWACSLCLTTWIGLIYIFIQGCFTIPMIAYVLLLAYLTPVTYIILIDVKEALITIINYFSNNNI